MLYIVFAKIQVSDLDSRVLHVLALDVVVREPHRRDTQTQARHVNNTGTRRKLRREEVSQQKRAQMIRRKLRLNPLVRGPAGA